MRQRLKSFLWHPFLVALFPVVFLYAHNIFYVELRTSVYPILLVLVLTAILVGLGKILFRDWLKAGVWTSTFWFLFFLYSTLFSVLEKTSLHHHSYLLLMLSIILAGIGLLLMRSRSKLKTFTKVLNVFSAILILFPLWQISSYFVSERLRSAGKAPEKKINWTTTATATDLPDIVYLILDGYGRKDVLQQYYQYDNQEFLNSLQLEGFNVLPRSTSNYMRTAVSVASSLNLNYIQALSNYHPEQSYQVLENLIENAILLRWLQQHKYGLYTFDSGFIFTEFRQRTIHLDQGEYFPELYKLLLQQTPLQLFENNAMLYRFYSKALLVFGYSKSSEHFRENQRGRILFALENLHKYIGKSQPSFVFADVFVGHPPFIFDKNGNYIAPPKGIPAVDGSEFLPTHPQRRQIYRQGVREQTTFLNKKILEAVQQLKKNIKRPTVIILQGDHGPGLHYDQISPAKTNHHERLSILNAIYVSGNDSLNLPPDLTPVNTFRIILNHYFHTQLPLLPNKNYYSPVLEPCQFTDVTEAVIKTLP